MVPMQNPGAAPLVADDACVADEVRDGVPGTTVFDVVVQDIDVCGAAFRLAAWPVARTELLAERGAVLFSVDVSLFVVACAGVAGLRLSVVLLRDERAAPCPCRERRRVGDSGLAVVAPCFVV